METACQSTGGVKNCISAYANQSGRLLYHVKPGDVFSLPWALTNIAETHGGLQHRLQLTPREHLSSR